MKIKSFETKHVPSLRHTLVNRAAKIIKGRIHVNKQVNNGNCRYHVTPTYGPGTGEGPFYSPVFTPYSLYGHSTYSYPANSYDTQRLNNIDPIPIIVKQLC